MFYYNGWESGKWEVLNGGTSYKFICGAKSGKREMMWCVEDDRKQTKVPDEIKKCKAISNKITPLKLQLSDLSSIDKPIKSWLSLNKPKINSSYGIVCFASQLGSPGGIFNNHKKKFVKISLLMTLHQ